MIRLNYDNKLVSTLHSSESYTLEVEWLMRDNQFDDVNLFTMNKEDLAQESDNRKKSRLTSLIQERLAENGLPPIKQQLTVANHVQLATYLACLNAKLLLHPDDNDIKQKINDVEEVIDLYLVAFESMPASVLGLSDVAEDVIKLTAMTGQTIVAVKKEFEEAL